MDQIKLSVAETSMIVDLEMRIKQLYSQIDQICVSIFESRDVDYKDKQYELSKDSKALLYKVKE